MGIMKEYDCIHCGLHVIKGNTAGKYCSISCQKKHQSDVKMKEWIRSNIKIGKSIARRYLNETQGYKCSVCLLSEWLKKPLVLEIDHTDGDAYNNRPENLRLICPNCHSQTSTFKNRNKGNGRKLRNSSGWLLV